MINFVSQHSKPKCCRLICLNQARWRTDDLKPLWNANTGYAEWSRSTIFDGKGKFRLRRVLRNGTKIDRRGPAINDQRRTLSEVDFRSTCAANDLVGLASHFYTIAFGDYRPSSDSVNG